MKALGPPPAKPLCTHNETIWTDRSSGRKGEVVRGRTRARASGGLLARLRAPVRDYADGCMCPKGCTCVRADGLNVTCSRAHLKEIPPELPADTALLWLDHNQIASVPARAFQGLRQLRELNLSHNALETLGESALWGVEGTLQTLDISHNQISRVHKDVFALLKARVHVGHNPWHCDCALQQALRGMAYNHEAAGWVFCKTSELPDLEGRPFLAVDADLCNLAKRTTDYAMLVTMFGWFAMVISYVVYYVRQNQEDARRHLEYLKSLPSKPKKPDDGEDVSTVV
ncbi:leucine-rich repeat-containing protein 3B isoform X2 [Scleropages formosus]|uniref:leucine-rich repeat-containing protein 3B isoform X2 n=1 Tax=Scleropages formosus TaxID=113540 RepID=UPI0010FA93C0|nr:leucine-rich repeat-containing protein 3B isoform X2 [Scleropages formosus]